MGPVGSERVLTLGPENTLSNVIVNLNLKVGDVVAARVVRALTAQHLLLSFDGQPLRVQSGIEVPVGAELQLRVREIGRTVVLDLVRAEVPSARQPATTPTGLSSPTSSRSGPDPQVETRALHAEVAAAIAQLEPMGRVALEIKNLLGALPESRSASRSSTPLAQLTHGLRELVFPWPVEAEGSGATALAKFDPAIVLQLLKLIESITGEQMGADPQARTLDALLSVITQSHAVREGSIKEREAAGLAPAAVPRAKMAELLEGLLSASVSERHASATQALTAAVDTLDPEEKLLLAALAASREQALIAASPEAAWLGRVHQALSTALANEALSRLASMMLSEDGKSFDFVQILSAVQAKRRSGFVYSVETMTLAAERSPFEVVHCELCSMSLSRRWARYGPRYRRSVGTSLPGSSWRMPSGAWRWRAGCRSFARRWRRTACGPRSAPMFAGRRGIR